MATPFQFRGADAPNPPPRQPRRQNRSKPGNQARNRPARPSNLPPRPRFTFRCPPPPTSERPLLSTKREPTPEQLHAEEDTGSKPAHKFKFNLDGASPSSASSADMDISEPSSDDAESDNPEHPRKRRVPASNVSKMPDVAPLPAPPSAPKWSNPDPYTVLPPPDESKQQKVDVVDMIRKARLPKDASGAAKTNAVVQNDDFISLGGADGADDTPDDHKPKAPNNAPTGPKNMVTENRAQQSASSMQKRTHDGETKGFSNRLARPVEFGPYRKGDILTSWRALSVESAAPWFEDSGLVNVASRLHSEICDFYAWIRPRDFEQIVREDLVSRLQQAFEGAYPGCQLRAFGSFASGLYLPVADVDLVLLSPGFQRTHVPHYGLTPSQIWKFSKVLDRAGISIPRETEVIAHARVPIIKLVDKVTGLHVDISFDNDSGIMANETFKEWRKEFPQMPVLVSIIKQFLLIRGLNEVPTGGLGGFSITCMVTSFLNHIPDPMKQNLGRLLLDFLDFYGNVHEFQDSGIRLKPPMYFNKARNMDFARKGPRLTIEDPNNILNDISGGTRDIDLILSQFGKAFRELSLAMNRLAKTNNRKESILATIMGGNYAAYAIQRDQLHEVFERSARFAEFRNRPPPPPAYSPPPPPSPPPLPPGPPPPGPPPQ
ncbi:poly(A) RNA polymerase cid14 [Penicillium argentinense]|uniref:polynucleotide adenylyltransferase n=1 Tax=Penicillium argentinense TaxID=1131581 RepID=A0A9W9EHX8_9EURO|nr:poly(A) RNA polymerase cid14 [Penicillium argentinense]KAJ5082104.1 poly(A) RNA polymerase cid14 [Penicillium argentinense]